MKRRTLSPVALLRIGIAYLLAVAPTVTMYVVLDAEGPLWLLVAYVLAVQSVFQARALWKGHRAVRVATAAAGAVLVAAGAAAITIALNLTPASAYLVWFRLVSEGTASGTLSYMFCLKFSFLTSFLSGFMVLGAFVPSLLGYIGMNAILLTAIYQQEFLMWMTAGSLAAFVLSLALIPYRRFRVRPFFSALQIVVIALLAAWPLSLLPRNTSSLLIDTIPLDPLSSFVIRVFPEFPFLYNMPGYGYSFGEKSIGGKPSLTARPVFEFTGEPGETVYLRTSVFSSYTGSGWSVDPDLMTDASVGYRFRDFVRTAPLIKPRGVKEVEVLIDFYSSLPHTLDTSYLSMRRRELPDIRYGSMEVGYQLAGPVTKGQIVYIHEDPVPAESADFELPQTYRTISARLPQQVIREARLIGGEGTISEKLARIKEYLSKFTYTLDTKPLNPDADAVADFLFTSKKGYCVHFATAYALMARINGIPTRYATGFLVNIPRDSNSVTVTGLSAHAWPEVWIEGRGWQVMEATPPLSSDYYMDPYYYYLLEMEEDAYTMSQLRGILGDRIPSTEGFMEDEELRPFPLIPVAAAAAAAVLLALILWAAADSVILRSSRTARLRILARRIIRRAEKRGTASPQGAGWLAWADSLARTDTAPVRHARRVASLCLGTFFGGAVPTDRDIAFVRSFSSKFL